MKFFFSGINFIWSICDHPNDIYRGYLRDNIVMLYQDVIIVIISRCHLPSDLCQQPWHWLKSNQSGTSSGDPRLMIDHSKGTWLVNQVTMVTTALLQLQRRSHLTAPDHWDACHGKSQALTLSWQPISLADWIQIVFMPLLHSDGDCANLNTFSLSKLLHT